VTLWFEGRGGKWCLAMLTNDHQQHAGLFSPCTVQQSWSWSPDSKHSELSLLLLHLIKLVHHGWTTLGLHELSHASIAWLSCMWHIHPLSPESRGETCWSSPPSSEPLNPPGLRTDVHLSAAWGCKKELTNILTLLNCHGYHGTHFPRSSPHSCPSCCDPYCQTVVLPTIVVAFVIVCFSPLHHILYAHHYVVAVLIIM
jgi:hypothetical protein